MMYGSGMGFIWILVIALVVVAVIWAVRSNGQWQGPSGPAAPPDPGRILDERFASGEIDEQEYRRRRDLLSR